jgi:putative MFS transporter
MITEFSPSKTRGTLSVIINICWGLGGTLAAFVGYSVVIEHGWRLAMLFGGIAFLLALLIRLFFPESMRFLFRKGRFEEAQKQFARIHLVPRDDAGSIPLIQDTPLLQNGAQGGLWSKRYAHITFAIWFMWFGLNFLYQGAFVWLPTLLASTQISEGRSFLLTILISLGQVPGTLIVAFLVDRTKRAGLLIASMLLLASATLLLGFSQNDIWILVVGFILMIFNGMAWGMAYSFSAELYPTRMRASATGWAAGVGRLGGLPAPILVGLVLQQGGSLMLVFGLLALAPFLATLVVSTVKTDTTGKSLEAISAE